MRLAIRDQFHKQSYGIWLFEQRFINGASQKLVAKPVQLEFVECKDHFLPEPTLEIDARHIQELISTGTMEFEMSGLGKTFNSTHQKELSAVQNHLEDMKTILFHEIGIGRNK